MGAGKAAFVSVTESVTRNCLMRVKQWGDKRYVC